MPTRQKASSPQYVIIGRLGRCYGTRGWLRIQSFTEHPTDLFNYPDWHMQHRGHWQAITVTQHKVHGDSFIIKLADCDTPEQARLYANNPVGIFKQELPILAQEEYYWTDLIGLRVVNSDNIELGIVDHLLETASNDVMVVKGKKRHLLPYTDDVVQSIDLKQKQMIVEWDEDF